MKKKLNVIIGLIAFFGVLSMMNMEEPTKVLANTSYRVIKVNGKIFFVRTNSNMKQGDVYVDGTKLTFGTNESRAAIINKIKGRCVLSPAEKGAPKILPATNNISSRSGALLNLIDLKNHFSGNYLVIGKMKLEIGDKAYPQNDKNFFYLAYDYKDELIRKKLPSEGKMLMFNPAEIFKVDNQLIPVQKGEMALYYMKNGSSDLIASFNPVFVDSKDLKSEIEIIMGEYTDRDSETIKKEVTAYLNEFYGKPQKINLSNWLESEFKL